MSRVHFISNRERGNHLWLKLNLVYAVNKTKKLLLLKGTQKKTGQKFQSIAVQHQTKGGDSMHNTGEKPGMGTYVCISCGQTVSLDEDTDRLPPCPNCHETTYKKIG